MLKRVRDMAFLAAAGLLVTAGPVWAQAQEDTWEGSLENEQTGESVELEAEPAESDAEVPETVTPEGEPVDELESDTEVSESVTPSEEGEPIEGLTEEEQRELEAVVPREDTGQVIVMEGQPARLRESQNVAIEVGGGFSSYTSDLNDALENGGNWDVRAVLGTSSPVGLELGYFGAANGFENLDDTAIATAGEAVVRINLQAPTAGWQPFIGGGIDYFRLDGGEGQIDGTEALGFPVTAGISFYPLRNFTIGARGTYRFLTDLLDDNFPDGDNWNAGLTLGATF